MDWDRVHREDRVKNHGAELFSSENWTDRGVDKPKKPKKQRPSGESALVSMTGSARRRTPAKRRGLVENQNRTFDDELRKLLVDAQGHWVTIDAVARSLSGVLGLQLNESQVLSRIRAYPGRYQSKGVKVRLVRARQNRRWRKRTLTAAKPRPARRK